MREEIKERMRDVPREGKTVSEVQKRLRNLMWTVSGDYDLDAQVDEASFSKSPCIALYDAIRQGAFARYFNREALDQYLKQKVLLGAEPTVLQPIARMCMDSAVWKKAAGERSGIPEIRRKAFEETLIKDAMRLTHTNWGELEASYLHFCLTGERKAPWAARFVDRLCSIQDAEQTEQVIACVDEVYEEAYAKGFADWFKGLDQLKKAGGRPDESLADEGAGEKEEERTFEFLSEQLKTEEDSDNQRGEPSLVVLEDDSVARMKTYVEQNYGKSYLSDAEQRCLEGKICTGAHSGRHLHITDGILHENNGRAESRKSDAIMEAGTATDRPKCEFDRKIKEENYRVYKENELVTRQNIRSLADVLLRGLFTREERENIASEYGEICVNKLWNLGRTKNRKLFNRKSVRETEPFAVEVLIDASGSQQVRQSKVALQAYIIAEALSLAGIPHRVVGFCTFGEYTVLRRFRDYDEGREANERIFEFYGSANNRDGLAIRAAAESLAGRREENKILIVLSDGTPNDIILTRSKFVKGKNGRMKPSKAADGSQEPYCSDYAVWDTASEVYSLRNKGIKILGIFAGEEEALADERTIFGNEFVYIRDIASFSNVVGRYLKEQILER